MKLKQLISVWKAQTEISTRNESITIQVSLEDNAKIMALSQMFPGRNQQQIVTELLAVALGEIEEEFPYIPGPKVITTDEFGDPIYEDIGLTPTFEKLSIENLKKLRK